jgi:DNA-binding response OmpR family regulator
MATKILVVEDDPGIAKVLCDNLTIDGFTTKWAPDGHHAQVMCRSFQPDLVLLDLMLPGHDGYELCGVLRQGGRRPVIMVSARSQRADKIRGLEGGADDYVTKPFDIEELVARIHAVLRRFKGTSERLKLGDLIIDFTRLTAATPAGKVHLTHREFEVLRYLSDHRDRTVHRDQLLADVWGVLDGSTTRSVDFAIARLRRKVEADPHSPRFIRTVHGDGYCLTGASKPPGRSRGETS